MYAPANAAIMNTQPPTLRSAPPVSARPLVQPRARTAPRPMTPPPANASDILDGRTSNFYDGGSIGGQHGEKHRRGHVKSAKNVPYDQISDDHDTIKSNAALQALFTKAGVKPGDTVIGYCHIGQQATAMLFAARLLGHPVLLYDGSFQDWSRHTEYPVETAGSK